METYCISAVFTKWERGVGKGGEREGGSSLVAFYLFPKTEKRFQLISTFKDKNLFLDEFSHFEFDPM